MVSYGFSWKTCSLNLEQRIPLGEPLLHLELRGVIAAGAVVVEGPDVAELRERPQQLRARDRRRVEGRSREQTAERIRDECGEEIDVGLIAHAAGRKVLRRDGVELDLAGARAAARRQIPSAAAGVAAFDEPLALQLTLQAD